MAEWLYEAGIGEARAALVEDGAIVEARIELPGLRAGTVAEGRLRAENRVELADGEALLDIAPRGVTQGAKLTVDVQEIVIGWRLVGSCGHARGLRRTGTPVAAMSLEAQEAEPCCRIADQR